MADYARAAGVVGVIMAAGAVAALAAPAFGQRTEPVETQSVFGIKSSETVFGYRRQAAWKDQGAGRFSVSPPRPDPAFRHYALSSDPGSNKICAVYASSTDEAALGRLRTSLTRTHGEPSLAPANGHRWGSGSSFVEIQEVNGTHHAMWDFTGTCISTALAQGSATRA